MIDGYVGEMQSALYCIGGFLAGLALRDAITGISRAYESFKKDVAQVAQISEAAKAKLATMPNREPVSKWNENVNRDLELNSSIKPETCVACKSELFEVQENAYLKIYCTNMSCRKYLKAHYRWTNKSPNKRS